MEDAGTPQDKLERLLEDGKISEAEYDQLADAMHRHTPAQSDEADQAAQREPLRKDVGRAWVAGVCAGLGRYSDIDPIVPRIIAVAAVFVLGPMPVLLYLILCGMMPWDDPEAARESRAGARPLRFALVVALLLVILPIFYCAFVVPHIAAICEDSGVRIWSSSFQGTLSGRAFDAASEYQFPLAMGASMVAVFLCLAVHFVIHNARSLHIFERVVIWSSFLWLLFLVVGTVLPLVSMLTSLE